MDQRQAVAGVFDRAAGTYDQVGVDMFGPIAELLVREVRPRPGERALDVGCGRGAVALPLAAAVAPSGAVTAVDLSPRMVDATRQAAAKAGADVDVRLADAQDLDLPAATYDLITSSLVLFFLPDPLTALTRWRELLVPGGRLGVSTFGPYSAAWREVDAVFEPYLPPGMRDARTSGVAGPFSSDAGMEALLRDAGFAAVRTVTMGLDVRFADVEHWYRWTWSVAQRAMWEAVPDAQRATVRAAAFERVDACRDAAGRIGFEQQVRITLGER